MSYNVIAIPKFRKELKKLAKKYSSIKNDFSQLIESLEQAPHQGTALGNSCYKIRMAIASKSMEKLGGSRVITYVHVSQSTVYLLSIYDKADQESMADNEIRELLTQIPD